MAEPVTVKCESAAAPSSGKKVLIVEDDQLSQRVSQAILEKAGYDVFLTTGGMEAINAALTQDFDLILMDIYMPGMDGLETTRLLRALEASEQKPRVPIVALTAHAIIGCREDCLRNDMDDYLTKPTTKAQLLRVVARWVESATENSFIKSTSPPEKVPAFE